MYWVKLSPNVLFYPAQIVLFLTQCFLEYAELFIIVLREIKADGRKLQSIFFVLFYKKAKILFYCECTQIKANRLQFRLSS